MHLLWHLPHRIAWWHSDLLFLPFPSNIHLINENECIVSYSGIVEYRSTAIWCSMKAPVAVIKQYIQWNIYFREKFIYIWCSMKAPVAVIKQYIQWNIYFREKVLDYGVSMVFLICRSFNLKKRIQMNFKKSAG